jgi:myo-inositol 2-dehydrogenase/D-chiro-inositol 1-dehydrogenase
VPRSWRRRGIVHDVDPDARRRRAAPAPPATVDEALGAADAVLVAASTNAHAALVSRAIDAGLPVFVEKPLAFDLEETVALVDKAEAAGAVVQVGFQRRFDAAHVEARRLVESGELGTVYLVRLIASDHEPPPDAYIPVSGGLFRDSSIHDFDSLRWVTGQEVTEVYAAGAVRGFPVFAEHGDVDTGAAILSLADGTLAVLGQTRHDPLGYDVRMEVIGSRDAVTVGLDRGTPIRSLEAEAPVLTGPAWTSFLTRFEAAYNAELLAFLRSRGARSRAVHRARDALQAMRIAAPPPSRLEHRPVRLAEVP